MLFQVAEVTRNESHPNLFFIFPKVCGKTKKIDGMQLLNLKFKTKKVSIFSVTEVFLHHGIQWLLSYINAEIGAQLYL